MPTADPNYRPNPERAIHVCRAFDEELAAEALPKIAAYRAVSNDPITVYINSPGGSIRVLETIECALRCGDQDGNRCRLITVAIGDAGSAAASLLTLGDYAISYRNSVIHYHGVRLSEVDVTMEDASSVATRLLAMNRQIAHKSAEQCINRLMQRFMRLQPEVEKLKKKGAKNNKSEVARFVECILKRVSPAARRVINNVLYKIETAEKLSVAVIGDNFNFNASLLRQDVAVFKSVLAYELKQKKGTGFRLDEKAVYQMASDYCLLRDFQMGEHYRPFGRILRMHGPLLLNEKDYREYKSGTLSEKEKVQWLSNKIGEVMRALWHFSVIMCRQLQSGENGLTPEDAYWMGCIDEVVGTDLYGERVIMEEDTEEGGDPDSGVAPVPSNEREEAGN